MFHTGTRSSVGHTSRAIVDLVALFFAVVMVVKVHYLRYLHHNLGQIVAILVATLKGQPPLVCRIYSLWHLDFMAQGPFAERLHRSVLLTATGTTATPPTLWPGCPVHGRSVPPDLTAGPASAAVTAPPPAVCDRRFNFKLKLKFYCDCCVRPTYPSRPRVLKP